MNETNSSITINFSGSITIPGYEMKALFETALKAVLSQNLQAEASAPAQEMIVSRKPLYTVKDVAQLLGMSDKTVYRLIQRGLLRASSALRHKRIPAASIEKFIRSTV